MSIDRTVRMNLLFDFYAPLLTEKQRSLFVLYRQADLSLGEIAEQEGVSRQAVYDIVKRAEAALLDLESQLRLAEAYERRQVALRGLTAEVEALRAALCGCPAAARAALLSHVDAIGRQIAALAD